jgi:hypothetical protein
MVMDVPVAMTSPLKETHELLVVYAAGAKSIASAQEVDPAGLHFTVQDTSLREFVLIQPEIVYSSPMMVLGMTW